MLVSFIPVGVDCCFRTTNVNVKISSSSLFNLTKNVGRDVGDASGS
jgi:hypothetical protein